ncbi:hypothetical protein HMI54_014202 [Coelomomyces lativittatus]|nr:hypothetical protein HMI54_014202 [Coelomomyces lativittatus]KAJ1498492.1 hypothetical protein HMI55_004896 [Coelomomyces lativittatus]
MPYKISELNVRFSLLREIGNLFLVRPENLMEIIDEGLLASLDRGIIWTYLSNRTDFKTEKIDVMLRQRCSEALDFSYEDSTTDSLNANLLLENESKRPESVYS